jgi:hypothetical protein
VLQPGGFSRYGGEVVPAARRLLLLIAVFAQGLVHGWLARLGLVTFLLPAGGFSIYVLVRASVDQLNVAKTEQATFVCENLARLQATNLAWLLLALAWKVAPVIARDAAHGALLLYFTRPVERSHYGIARWASAALIGFGVLIVPYTLLWAVQWLMLGSDLGGTALVGWKAPVFWLGMLATGALASALAASASALVALCCGVVARGPGTAPLVFGGGVLASLAVSFVLIQAWGDDSAAKSLNLHHALRGFHLLLTAPLQPDSVPRAALYDATLGVGLWVALGALAWTWLQRFLEKPPLGRARSA